MTSGSVTDGYFMTTSLKQFVFFRVPLKHYLPPLLCGMGYRVEVRGACGGGEVSE